MITERIFGERAQNEVIYITVWAAFSLQDWRRCLNTSVLPLVSPTSRANRLLSRVALNTTEDALTHNWPAPVRIGPQLEMVRILNGTDVPAVEHGAVADR